jgi:predicted nucleic acid-binding protein
MTRIVVLDTGPLGLASKPRGKGDADRCRAWIRALDAAGIRVVIPEVCDYELRRELVRCGATAGIARLDELERPPALDYAPITTPAMRLAAEFWSHVRRAGMPTADRHAIDADCILAAQALLLRGPDDVVTIATTNLGHLGRFPGVEAEPWEAIAP